MNLLDREPDPYKATVYSHLLLNPTMANVSKMEKVNLLLDKFHTLHAGEPV